MAVCDVLPTELRLTAIPPERWRPSRSGMRLEDDPEWRTARRAALEAQNFTCALCGFRGERYMEVHHWGGESDSHVPGNLVALCPLCHSCLHVGFSGLRRRGRLVILAPGALGQAHLNRGLLESCRRGGLPAVEIFLSRLDVRADFGPEGLVDLANSIIEERARSGGEGIWAPPLLKYLPFLSAYPIFGDLDRSLRRAG